MFIHELAQYLSHNWPSNEGSLKNNKIKGTVKTRNVSLKVLPNY